MRTSISQPSFPRRRFASRVFFLGGHDEVVRTDDVAQGDLRLRHRLEEIEGIAVIGDEGGFVGEAVELQRVGERPLGLGMLERPALQVHHRGVGVDAGDPVGTRRGVAVGVETAAAHPLEGGFRAEPPLLANEFVKAVHDRERVVAPQHRHHVDMGDVETAFDEFDIDLGVEVGKGGPPDPGFSGRGFLRQDDEGLVTLEVEGLLREALPIRISRGHGIGGVEGGAGHQQAGEETERIHEGRVGE